MKLILRRRSIDPRLAFAVFLASCNGSDGSDSSGGASETNPTSTPTTGDSGELCGDGVVEAPEECEEGVAIALGCAELDDAFAGGELGCAADCSFDTTNCQVDPNAALVVLNEVTSQGVLAGPYADQGDAIEVYNAGGAAADLGGWKLSDDSTFPADKTYVFPAGTTLAPGTYVVLVAYDAVAMTGQLPFGISNDKEETLTLVDAAAEPADELILNGLAAAVSYCRVPDGTGAWQQCEQTFGGANKAASVVCGDGEIGGDEDCDGADLQGQTCEGLGIGFTGGALTCSAVCSFDASTCSSGSMVVINELEATEDQIELHNAGDQAVDLSGWILTDDDVDPSYDGVSDLEKLVFAAGTTLAAGAFLAIPKGELAGQHVFGLAGTGDTLTLLMPSLDVADQVSYGDSAAKTSYCRLPDGPGGAWTADCTPTFGMANTK